MHACAQPKLTDMPPFSPTVARQAKALGAKLRIAAGEGEIGEEEEEEEGDDEDGAARGARWGASKRAYYDADVVDMEGSDEEDALADEEAEAVRLQRAAAAALRPDDFGADEDEDETSSEEDDEEPTLGARAAGGAAVEAIARDDDAAAAAVRQDALELSALLDELRAVLGEVRGRLGPLLREVRQGELATAEGVSYLEAKHTLLVHYAASIVFYLLLKAEGRPVRDHPVIKRLVEVRSYLEKVRPVDKRLQYQIEKLLAAAAAAQGAGDEGGAAGEELRHGPRPEALVAVGGPRGAAAAAEGDDGVYRPPRLNPVSMELEGEREGGAGRRERRKEEMTARRAARSSLVQELAAELTGAPEELGAGAPLGMDTVAALRQRQRLAARDAVEEELMVRVPLSRQERKQLKAQRREGLSGKALLDDFADDVADLVGLGGPGGASGGGGVGEFGRHRANQKFGADLAAQAAAAARRNPRSGDDDLPARESLTDRRAKMDGSRAQAALSYPDEDAPDGGKKRRAGGEEDAFYTAAKEAAAAKKRARQEDRAPAELLPPAEDPTAEGARRINSAIDKNRGLTPHRKKELKNPRKKHRVKFAEAGVRRRGQVQEVREQGGAYGGEGTGIKARVSKSVKF